jgi:hypothetical protein
MPASCVLSLNSRIQKPPEDRNGQRRDPNKRPIERYAIRHEMQATEDPAVLSGVRNKSHAVQERGDADAGNHEMLEEKEHK